MAVLVIEVYIYGWTGSVRVGRGIYDSWIDKEYISTGGGTCDEVVRVLDQLTVYARGTFNIRGKK